jgi:hypothetical protein
VIPANLSAAYAALRRAHPTSSTIELLRFATLGDSALESYKAHLEWRRNVFPLVPHDPEVFYPVEHAAVFPRAWLNVGGVAKDGSKLIVCQGAMYDKDCGGVQAFVDKCVHTVDTCFPTPGTEGRITLLIDVRGFDHMRNSPATQMISFFRATGATLSANYPDRLQKIVIYAVPFFLLGVIKLVMKVLPKDIRDKLEVLGGKATETPLKLFEVVDFEQLPDAVKRYHDLATPYVHADWVERDSVSAAPAAEPASTVESASNGGDEFSQFNGEGVQDRTEGLEEYMKKMNMPWMLRKAMSKAKLTQQLRLTKDDYEIVTGTPKGQSSFIGRWGDNAMDKTPLGKDGVLLCELAKGGSGELVIKSKMETDGVRADVVSRSVVNGELIMSVGPNAAKDNSGTDASMRRIFKRKL